MADKSSKARSKSIAMLHFAVPPVIGGVESVIGHHARLMTQAGHQVTLLGGRGSSQGPDVPFIELPLIDSQHPEILEAKKELDQGRVPAQADALVTKIYDQLSAALSDVDVLIAHNICTMAKNLFLTAALRRLAGEEKGPKVIAWHHDLAATANRYANELHSGWPWSIISENWTEASLSHVAVSQMRQQELSELWDIKESDIQVIPSGLTVESFFKFEDLTREIFDQWKLEKANPLLLLPVRITRRKNLELALQVTASLAKRFPQATLIVTGPPGAHNSENATYLDELLELRSSLGLDPSSKNPSAGGGRVLFLGENRETFLPDEVIADLYRAADALLITSTEEGFGIPIIESALSRIPIFCSELAPFKEIAGNHAQYFSVKDSADSIATRIAESIDSDSLHALRKHTLNSYSWSGIYDQRIAPLLEETP